METISTVLLSFGLSGRVFHAPFLKVHPGFRLSGAWERNEKRIKNSFPECRSFESLDEILNDGSIDLVVVNTPTLTHFEYAKRALEAGKHVIVEKAFTTSVSEAEELKALSENQGKLLAVFHNRRWDSDFLSVREVVESGILGDVREAEIRMERYKPELSPKKHKEDPNPGAGLLKDLGVHIIDQALVLFGMPVSLKAELRSERPGSKVDDWLEIFLYYNGFSVKLCSSLLVKGPRPAYVIRGSKGSFYKNRADRQETDLQKGILPGSPGWGTESEQERGSLVLSENGSAAEQKLQSMPGNYMAFYDQLYQALTGNKPVPVSAQEGINVMKIVEAVIISNREGRMYRLG